MAGPQPLSNFSREITYRSNMPLNCAGLHPDLYHLAMRVISIAAMGEADWARTFGHIFASNPLPSFAIYNALESERAKRNILLAAAKVSLSDEDFLWLQATFKAVAPAFKVRHKFAHHLWGDSPELSDALLLAEPEALVHEPVMLGLHSIALQARGEPFDEVAFKATNYDRSRIFVWTKDALDSANEDMLRATTAIGAIGSIIVPGPVPESARNYYRNILLQWPRFEEALTQLRAKQHPRSQ